MTVGMNVSAPRGLNPLDGGSKGPGDDRFAQLIVNALKSLNIGTLKGMAGGDYAEAQSIIKEQISFEDDELKQHFTESHFKHLKAEEGPGLLSIPDQYNELSLDAYEDLKKIEDLKESLYSQGDTIDLRTDRVIDTLSSVVTEEGKAALQSFLEDKQHLMYLVKCKLNDNPDGNKAILSGNEYLELKAGHIEAISEFKNSLYGIRNQQEAEQQSAKNVPINKQARLISISGNGNCLANALVKLSQENGNPVDELDIKAKAEELMLDTDGFEYFFQGISGTREQVVKKVMKEWDATAWGTDEGDMFALFGQLALEKLMGQDVYRLDNAGNVWHGNEFVNPWDLPQGMVVLKYSGNHYDCVKLPD